MEFIYLQPANVPKPAGDYSQGVKVKGGTLVVISGQVAWDVQGNLVGKGDIRAQTRQVFENLKNMLASAGATFHDVVKLGVTQRPDAPEWRDSSDDNVCLYRLHLQQRPHEHDLDVRGQHR